MNFNFNMNPQRRLPFMRNFSNVSLPVNKSVTDCSTKSDYILQNVPNSFLLQVHSNISPQKSFSNPNFVNKHNPNIFTPHKIDSSSQPAQKISSDPEFVEILNTAAEQPKVKKQKIGRRMKKNAAAKRAKQQNLSESASEKNMTKRHCSSPKKIKKEFKSSKTKGGKSNKHCKPWHKFSNEMMDYNETISSPPTPNTPEICSFPSFSLSSSPVEICSLVLSLKQSVISPSCDGTRLSISSSEGSPLGVNHALQRIRMVSECESEDSFIVFCDREDENHEEDDEEDFSSEDTSDVSDTDDSEDLLIEFEAEKTAYLPRETKKVSFRADPDLCEIHPMVQWSYAYHKARRGPWEQIARDRARFRDRIDKIDCKIGFIFCEAHRDRIYRERFE